MWKNLGNRIGNLSSLGINVGEGKLYKNADHRSWIWVSLTLSDTIVLLNLLNGIVIFRIAKIIGNVKAR